VTKDSYGIAASPVRACMVSRCGLARDGSLYVLCAAHRDEWDGREILLEHWLGMKKKEGTK